MCVLHIYVGNCFHFVNMQANDGGTALHCAAEFGHDSVVELLIGLRPTGQMGVMPGGGGHHQLTTPYA